MWSRTSHTHREGRAYTPRKKKKKTWGETFIYTFVHWTYNSNFLGQTKGFAHANPTITIRCPTLAFRIGQGPRHLYRIFFFFKRVWLHFFFIFFFLHILLSFNSLRLLHLPSTSPSSQVFCHYALFGFCCCCCPILSIQFAFLSFFLLFLTFPPSVTLVSFDLLQSICLSLSLSSLQFFLPFSLLVFIIFSFEEVLESFPSDSLLKIKKNK